MQSFSYDTEDGPAACCYEPSKEELVRALRALIKVSEAQDNVPHILVQYETARAQELLDRWKATRAY